MIRTSNSSGPLAARVECGNAGPAASAVALAKQARHEAIYLRVGTAEARTLMRGNHDATFSLMDFGGLQLAAKFIPAR